MMQGGQPSNIILSSHTPRNSYSFLNHLVHSLNITRGPSKRFIQVLARTQVHANSFFNRTIKNCNGLSKTVVSASTVDILN